MTADELRPTCGCEQGMGHMDPGCHSYGLCHVQAGGPGANPRRLAWFTDDELVAELERRATGNGRAEAAVRRVEDLISRYRGYESSAYIDVRSVRRALDGDFS